MGQTEDQTQRNFVGKLQPQLQKSKTQESKAVEQDYNLE